MKNSCSTSRSASLGLKRRPNRLLRALFKLLWAIKLLRPFMRRFWPTLKLKPLRHTILLCPTDNDHDRYLWQRGKNYDAASIGRLSLLVSGKQALIFDIGANSGFYTLDLATNSSANSKIFAFEPNPIMVSRLQNNLELNDLTTRVEVVPVALGSKEGQEKLYWAADNLGASSMRWVNSNNSITVPVRRLSSYIPESRSCFEIFLIKIDVEGYEDKILAPFLHEISIEWLPDVILIETAFANCWDVDLNTLLIEHGYASLFEGEEGNTLYMKRPEIFV